MIRPHYPQLSNPSPREVIMATKTFPRSLEMLTRFLFVTLILVALANVAGAYTIVFRSGQRIEVPATFEVGAVTVTYELAPGINKTLQLALIDIAATERVNHEAPGGFFKHSPEPAIISDEPPIQRASRTLTNRDLEPIRQRRIESEKAYEKRRGELGLPTLEESRRQRALEEESTLALARQRAADNARNEAYWRDRASALRSEFDSVDAQIAYLRSRPVENQGPIYGYPNVYGYPNNGYPNVYGYPNNGYPNVYGYPNNGYPNGQQYPSPYERRRARNQGTTNGRRPDFGVQVIIPNSPPYQPPYVYGNSSNQDDKLDNLMMRRADLESRWRTLEDDARRAKVPQVWLLP
jgi:hypothetical protein